MSCLLQNVRTPVLHAQHQCRSDSMPAQLFCQSGAVCQALTPAGLQQGRTAEEAKAAFWVLDRDGLIM